MKIPIALWLVSAPSLTAGAFPDVAIAETQRLEFHVSTSSEKSSLATQVDGAINELLRKNGSATIVKLRVFADRAALDSIRSRILRLFHSKALPLPALALLGADGFPEKGRLVAMESTSSSAERVNRYGLAFLAGLASPSGDGTITGLAKVVREAGVDASQVMRISCFYESPELIASARKSIATTFSHAESLFVKSYALAPVPMLECEAVARLNVPSQERIRYFNPAGAPPSPNFSRAALVTAKRLVFLEMQEASGESDADLRGLFNRLNAAANRAGVSLADTVMAGNYWLTATARDRLRGMRTQHYGKTVPAATGIFFAGLAGKDSTAALELTIAAPDEITLTVGTPLIDGTNVYKAHTAQAVQTIVKGGATLQRHVLRMEKSVIQKDGVPVFRLLIDTVPGANDPKYHSETMLNLQNMGLLYREDRTEGGLTRVFHVDGMHVSGYEEHAGESVRKPIDFTLETPSFYYPFIDAAINAVAIIDGDVFRVAAFDATSRKTEWHTYRVTGQDAVLIQKRKVKAWIVEEDREDKLVRKVWLTREPPYFPLDLTFLADGSVRRIEQTLR